MANSKIRKDINKCKVYIELLESAIVANNIGIGHSVEHFDNDVINHPTHNSSKLLQKR